MATNVTVLGASGATVTIPFTSAANAAAAQAALGTISDLVQKSILTQYQYTGSGTVPAPTLVGGVVVSGNAPVDLGLLPGGEYSVVNNAENGTTALGGTTMVGTYNPMTVASGTGGLVFLNASSNAQIFLGGGTNIVNEAYDGANATIYSDGDTHVGATLGSTTINAFGTSSVQIQAGTTGSAVVYAMGDNVVNVVGDNTGNAVSIFGSGSSLGYIGGPTSDAYINAGDAGVTVGGGDSAGAITLVGGSGDDVVMRAHGLIDGGTGTNYLSTDSLAGATTLTSAGTNDIMVGNAAGNTYNANGTNTLLVDQSDANSSGGATYNTSGGGSTTIYGSVAANSTFNLGAGSVLAYGQHGAGGNVGNIYTDAYDGANQITIGDFLVGKDVFSLSNSASGATLTSTTFYADAGTSAFGAVGTQAILSDGTTVDFLNYNVSNSSFT